MSNLTIEPDRYEGFNVYRWGTYGRSSVLAGQTKKSLVASFDTVEEALAAHPGAEVMNHRMSAGNTFDHLPGPDDPVPGGMYPDDW